MVFGEAAAIIQVRHEEGLDEGVTDRGDGVEMVTGRDHLQDSDQRVRGSSAVSPC